MDFKFLEMPVHSRQCSTEESLTQNSIMPSQQSIVYDEVGFTPEESCNGPSTYSGLDVNYDCHTENKGYGLTSTAPADSLQIDLKPTGRKASSSVQSTASTI